MKHTKFLFAACLVLNGCNLRAAEQHEHKTHHLDMTNLDMSNIQSDPKALAIPSSPVPELLGQQELYRCPMHPQIVQDHPGNCPICGMDLEKVEQAPQAAGASLQDRAAVKINSTRQQLIGLKTAKVAHRAASSTVRSVARVGHNEQNIFHIHTKYAGWLEEVYANFNGQYIQRGQALAKIYSPDLVAAQHELLVALASAKKLQNTAFFDKDNAVYDLAEAAEEKLRLYDMTSAQIESLKATGQVQRTVTIYAPESGYITDLKALQGMRVTAGTVLYSLVDLSEVWVQARVYENDLAQVRVGQEVLVTLPFYPEAKYSGHVSYIDPALDPQTRTANVRVVLPNASGILKPEMFAHVEIIVRKPATVLTIPAAAVIQTGKKNIAFVAKNNGYFEPREIKIGQRLGEDFELLQGLESGMQVVTDAQFLVDSESQMQAVVSKMQGGGGHVH